MTFSKYDRHGYTKNIYENNKELLSLENDYKSEMQAGHILGNFLEEVERANFLGNGRAKIKKNRMRKGI